MSAGTERFCSDGLGATDHEFVARVQHCVGSEPIDPSQLIPRQSGKARCCTGFHRHELGGSTPLASAEWSPPPSGPSPPLRSAVTKVERWCRHSGTNSLRLSRCAARPCRLCPRLTWRKICTQDGNERTISRIERFPLSPSPPPAGTTR